MKRQFLQMQPFQNKGYPSGQPASGAEWSPATDVQPGAHPGGQPGVPSTQQLEPAAYRPGTGLLSGWKPAQANTSGANASGNPQNSSFTGQEALSYMSQPTTQGPITGPAINPHVVQPQAFSAGQPSAYQYQSQSAMTPPSLPFVSGNDSGYGNSNGNRQPYSYADQQPVQPMMPAMMPAAASVAPVAPVAPVGRQQPVQPFGMQNMVPMAAMAPAPLSPLAPNPQQADPFGRQAMPQQADVWAAWPQGPGPQGPNSGYLGYPGYPGYQPPFGPGGPNSGGPGGGGQPPNFKKRKKRRVPIWARVVLTLLVLMLIALGGGAYYYEANFAAPISHIIGQQVKRYGGDENPNQARSTSGGILSGGRFNILLLGSDDDYKSRVINGGILAQTDIVVSIDPQTKSVSMFSIPRDTWLPVPGFGMRKLDQAYLLGGGGAQGAALTMYTIHQDFGIYLDHYAWVGLSGFTKVIDTVGGIDVDVIHPITDDDYPDDTGKGALDPYAVKRLYIAPGPQHMNGLTALEYVRSRHADLVGDFGRSVRQQQILNQLKYKLDNPSILGELSTLAQDLNGSVKTDMQLQDVYNLMYFAKGLDQSKIQKYTLGPPYSYGQTVGTQDVVMLHCNLVQPLIAKVFALGNNAQCNLQGNTGTSTLATATTTSTGMGIVQSANPWAATSDSLQVEAMSLSGQGNNADVLGIHSLLDLMFLAVFESPAAFQA